MDSSEYDEYEAIVRVRKGARFVRSSRTAGAHRGMTRDPDTHQVGQAELFLKENESQPVGAEPQDRLDSDRQESQARDQERRELQELVAEILVPIVLELTKKAAPHVRKWWAEQAFPAMRAKWSERTLPSVQAKWSSVSRSRRSDRRAEPTRDPQDPQDSRAIVPLSGEQRTTMSGTEAQERIVAAVLARAFSDEQLRLLRNARVVDEEQDSPVELGSTAGLTPQRLGEYVASMLEANPSLLDGDALAELGKFVANLHAEGNRVPRTVEGGACGPSGLAPDGRRIPGHEGSCGSRPS
ncbi:hypothetical protein G6045_07535 [Streptomyces sp. YC504]|uniref:Uncharacterized protein n=1 Tax=Streptomyces mesophilus TaxID=1775132 RepID=A0A6G4XFA2_9ACTN|nr:hypothetical protein [Streptomyces mesophilus]NGO75530.1 hypothetical protein [Streptomyces mesophilus]